MQFSRGRFPLLILLMPDFQGMTVTNPGSVADPIKEGVFKFDYTPNGNRLTNAWGEHYTQSIKPNISKPNFAHYSKG